MTDKPLEFTVDLAVIESLGMNLYSNAAAVLAELVANAWDADANTVSIDWNTAGDQIVIVDDGSGMTRDDLENRYLTVAYKKRENEGTTSPKFDRPFMGRKGIGKLSVFSLARTVTVYSAKDGHKNGFRIDVDTLRAKIAKKERYYPTKVTMPRNFPAHGTKIVLSELNRKRTGVSVAALRRRLARRFDTLGYRANDPKKFVIDVQGKPITWDDREDLKRLQYIWQLGSAEIAKSRTPKLKGSWVVTDNVVDKKRDWRIEGWFGTVDEPKALIDDEDENESLRNIIILARRRPIQEGILDQLDFNKIFGNYVTGQIRAEFLDLDDGSDDIATSDRQRLIEDDERARLLIAKLREMFNKAAEQWSVERPKQKFRELTQKYPAVRDWVQSRPTEQRAAAEKVVGTVAGLHLNAESERPTLFKSSILAFEKIALDSSVRELRKYADGLFAADLLPLLARSRTYEDALYVQILRARLEAIERLEGMINKDELEKVLQKHIFDNMWLLDPSWEGATEDKDMELTLKRIRRGLFDRTEEANKKQGRIDIQYRSAAGVHMIVELKKYRRVVKIEELAEQGGKYYDALAEVLEKRNAPTKEINVVFLLGERPKVGSLGRKTLDERVNEALDHINGRVLYYDEMLATAQRAYREYRDRRGDNAELDAVLSALDTDDDTGPDSPSTERPAPRRRPGRPRGSARG